jgi:hypothetical protein
MCSEPDVHNAPPPETSKSPTWAGQLRKGGQASEPPPPIKKKTNLNANRDENGNRRKVTPAGLFNS